MSNVYDANSVLSELQCTGNASLTQVRNIAIDDIIISIDGSISAGKTTIGKSIVHSLMSLNRNVYFYPESGHEYGVLEGYLKSPKETSCMFQSYMFSYCLLRASNAVLQRRLGGICIVDRTANGNKGFAVANTTEFFGGDITPEQFELYMLMYNRTMKYDIAPYSGSDLNLYIYASPEVCIRRLLTRDNKSEIGSYMTEYFQRLMTCAFLEVLQNLTSETPHPQIIVNWDTENPNVNRVYDAIDYYLSKDYTQQRVIIHRQSCNVVSEADVIITGSLTDPENVSKIMTLLSSGNSDLHITVPENTPSEYYSAYTIVIN